MADREPVAWITMHGTHVPIYAGDTKDDIYNRSVANRNADTKEKQIAKNKEQADKLNSEKNPPRRLYLDDIKAEDANKTSDVLNLRTKQRFKFKDGTKLTEVHVFAGKGCSKEFRDADKYAKRYPQSGKNPSDWQHCSGKATITNGSKTLDREVHWVQGADGKMREAFIKEYSSKNLKKRRP